ncbi:unnamed protein product, partial [Ceratitis capitata]
IHSEGLTLPATLGATGVGVLKHTDQGESGRGFKFQTEHQMSIPLIVFLSPGF